MNSCAFLCGDYISCSGELFKIQSFWRNCWQGILALPHVFNNSLKAPINNFCILAFNYLRSALFFHNTFLAEINNTIFQSVVKMIPVAFRIGYLQWPSSRHSFFKLLGFKRKCVHLAGYLIRDNTAAIIPKKLLLSMDIGSTTTLKFILHENGLENS